MKSSSKKGKAQQTSHPQNHRRRLASLLKQILSGKLTIKSLRESAEERRKPPYRRTIE